MATATETPPKEPDVTVTPAMRAKVEKAAAELAEARKAWQKATANAERVCRQAYEAGMTEVELARELNVDRARTVRRWLGKV